MNAKETSRVDLVSVVIPAYNAESTLGEQLDALKSQDYAAAWEVVVVDNRSSDGTVQLVHKYQHSMPNLRLVPAIEKQGRAYACNVGVRAAKGNTILFCDADDVVAPGWLQALTEALEKHDIVAGAMEVENQLNASAPWRPIPFISAKTPALKFLPCVPGCNCGMQRSCFDAAGGFSEDIPIRSPCEDIDFAWRLQLFHGYTLHDAPAAIIYYRYRDTLKGFWKQMVAYAEAQVYLYKQFADYGMPRPSALSVLKRYLKLAKRLLRLSRATSRQKSVWLKEAAVCWGRLKGSLRLRTFYL